MRIMKFDDVEITDVCGIEEAHDIVLRSMDDIHQKLVKLGYILS